MQRIRAAGQHDPSGKPDGVSRKRPTPIEQALAQTLDMKQRQKKHFYLAPARSRAPDTTCGDLDAVRPRRLVSGQAQKCFFLRALVACARVLRAFLWRVLYGNLCVWFKS